MIELQGKKGIMYVKHLVYSSLNKRFLLILQCYVTPLRISFCNLDTIATLKSLGFSMKIQVCDRNLPVIPSLWSLHLLTTCMRSCIIFIQCVPHSPFPSSFSVLPICPITDLEVNTRSKSDKSESLSQTLISGQS